VMEVDFAYNLFSYRAFNYLSLPWKFNRPHVTRFDSNGVAYLAADTGYSSYLWNIGSTSRIIPLATTGSYFVDVPYGIGYIRSEKENIANICGSRFAKINGDSVACAYSTKTYSATNFSDSLYNWKITGGVIVKGQKTPTVTVRWEGDALGMVKLVETTRFGCVDSTVSHVTVNTLTPAKIIGPDSICAGNIGVYQSSGQANTSYSWIIQGGTITAQNADTLTAEWGNGTSGVIKLIETDKTGCTDTTVNQVVLIPHPAAKISGTTGICVGNSGMYHPTVSQAGSHYAWKIKNGTLVSQNADTISVSWTQPGYGYVTLTETSSTGCTDSITSTVTVFDKPAVMINGRNSVCQKDIVSYATDNHQGSAYSWNITGGDLAANDSAGTIRVLWPASGTGKLVVTETSAAGCSNTSVINVNINPLPVANFSFSNTCLGNTASFTDGSFGADQYLWDFGDGDTSSRSNPLHKYYYEGTYPVSLKINSPAGCVDTISRAITVFPLPDARWTARDTGKEVIFTAIDTVRNDYSWNFGDGAIDTGAHPTHLYAADGNYLVNLTAYSTHGCISTYDSSVLIISSGINDKAGSLPERLSIYPNPSGGDFNIAYSLPKTSKVDISVLSMQGVEMLKLPAANQSQGDYGLELKASDTHLDPGMYILRFTIDGQELNKLLIINQ
jgi:hypothetical protein